MIEHYGGARRPRFYPSRVWVDYPGVSVFIDIVTRATGVILILPAEDESSFVFNDRGVAAGSCVRFVCVAGIVILIDQCSSDRQGPCNAARVRIVGKRIPASIGYVQRVMQNF